MHDNRRVSDTPELLVADAASWRAWLAANHATSSGVWLVLAKKGVSDPTRVRFTPRKPRSAWSQRNVELAEQLIAAGRMEPAGLAEAERAKADGRWERAYRGSASIEVPDDRREALAASPRAQAMWEVLTRTDRYAVLYRVHEAKPPETRARRIAQYVEMLARGDTPHPQAREPE